jgi:hypothetical protein
LSGPPAGFNAGEEAGQIGISQARLTKVLQAHTQGGLMANNNKSLFYNSVDVEALIKQASSTSAVQQSGGNFERIVDAGQMIGTDRNTGSATSIYTVITDSSNNFGYRLSREALKETITWGWVLS